MQARPGEEPVQWVGAERVDPTAWARSTERAVGALRLAAAGFGVAQLTLRELDHTAPIAAVWVVLGATAMLGLVALGTVHQLDRTDLERFVRGSFALDALLLSLPALLLAFDEPPVAITLLLILVVIGAYKFALTGALLAVGVIAIEEVIRQFLRMSLWRLDPTWRISAMAVAFSAVLGVALGWLARDAAARRDVAEREARRATLLAEQSAVTSSQITAMHRVVVAGIASVDADALDQMVHEVAVQLDLPAVSLLVSTSGDLVLGASTVPGAPVGQPVQLAPEGALATALDAGRSRISVGEDVETIGDATVRAQMVAPVHVHGRTIGALIVQSPHRGAFATEQLGMLQRLADQMGLVMEAARAFEQEAALVEQYRKLDEMKTDFVAITSHELRTPLTAVLGFAETLLRPDLELSAEQRTQLLTSVLNHARRLERLVEDLQTVSRIDHGTLSMELRDVMLAPILKSVIEASPNPQEIRTDGPDVSVHADPDRLHQVLANLITNAFDHGGNHVEVRWQLADRAVVITVADDGPGVPPEHRRAIFDRFFQAGDHMAHQRGSGLGLPIAAELMTAMGGRLWLEEDDEPGSRFSLELRPARSATLSSR